jgi:hypothetical protein
VSAKWKCVASVIGLSSDQQGHNPNALRGEDIANWVATQILSRIENWVGVDRHYADVSERLATNS